MKKIIKKNKRGKTTTVITDGWKGTTSTITTTSLPYESDSDYFERKGGKSLIKKLWELLKP